MSTNSKGGVKNPKQGRGHTLPSTNDTDILIEKFYRTILGGVIRESAQYILQENFRYDNDIVYRITKKYKAYTEARNLELDEYVIFILRHAVESDFNNFCERELYGSVSKFND